MRTIDCSNLYLPFLCHKLAYSPTALAQSIVYIGDGKPLAGVVYDNYNGSSVSAHIWIAEGVVPSRTWLAAIFDYPFRRLGVRKIVGQVDSKNSKALRLDERFGFVEEARIKGFFADSDLVLYTLTEADCRVLNSPRWGKVVDLVSRAV